MSKNKDIRSVSFNKTRDDDVKMLKHIEGKNFSGYVKALIIADIQKQDEKLKIVQKNAGGGIKIVLGR